MTSTRRNNLSRTAKRPHIYFSTGWWRVSLMSKPYHCAGHMWKWKEACLLVHRLNEERKCAR